MSMLRQASTILSPSNLSIVIPVTVTHFPSWVIVASQRMATLSPSATAKGAQMRRASRASSE